MLTGLPLFLCCDNSKSLSLFFFFFLIWHNSTIQSYGKKKKKKLFNIFNKCIHLSLGGIFNLTTFLLPYFPYKFYCVSIYGVSLLHFFFQVQKNQGSWGGRGVAGVESVRTKERHDWSNWPLATPCSLTDPNRLSSFSCIFQNPLSFHKIIKFCWPKKANKIILSLYMRDGRREGFAFTAEKSGAGSGNSHKIYKTLIQCTHSCIFERGGKTCEKQGIWLSRPSICGISIHIIWSSVCEKACRSKSKRICKTSKDRYIFFHVKPEAFSLLYRTERATLKASVSVIWL